MQEIEKLRNDVLNYIPTYKHKLFMDNLFMIYCDEIFTGDNFEYIPNRVKVSFEELNRAHLMCLLCNHNPSYNDLTNKKLDFNHLKEIEVI